MSQVKSCTQNRTVGIIVYRKEFTAGVKHGRSPGLMFDSDIYAGVIAKMGYNVVFIKPWAESPKVFEGCTEILAIEEMGSEEIIQEIRKRKLPVTLMVNLEVLDKNRETLAPTIKNFDIISKVIVKAKGLVPFAESMLKNFHSTAKINVVRHMSMKPLYIERDPARRQSVIHFAGVSALKNTHQQIIAGIELVRKHKFKSLIVKITFRRDNVSAIDRYTMQKINDLIDKNRDVVEYCDNNHISEEDKAKLYNSSRLALCASNSEGFGHYIAEAAYYGCQVITTDGVPMKELLDTKGCVLAKPDEVYLSFYSPAYVVRASQIVNTYEKLPKYSIDEIDNMTKFYEIHKERFETDFRQYFGCANYLGGR